MVPATGVGPHNYYVECGLVGHGLPSCEEGWPHPTIAVKPTNQIGNTHACTWPGSGALFRKNT